MPEPATLQDLAFYARDHFGEDGLPFEHTVPSSFDVIVHVYALESFGIARGAVRDHAVAVLRELLQSRGLTSAVADADEYVWQAESYLRSQFPDTASALKEQPILSNLFWHHLVEARLAQQSAREPVLA